MKYEVHMYSQVRQTATTWFNLTETLRQEKNDLMKQVLSSWERSS